MLGGSFRDIGPMVEGWRTAKRQQLEAMAKSPLRAQMQAVSTAQESMSKQIQDVAVRMPRNTDARLREQSERLSKIETALAKPAQVIDIQQALQPLTVRLGGVESAIRSIGDLAPAVDGVHRMLSDLNATMLALTNRLTDIAGQVGNASAPATNIAEPLQAIATQLRALPAGIAAVITAQAQRTMRQLQRQDRDRKAAQVALDARLAKFEKRLAPKRAKSKTKEPVRKKRRPTRNPGGKTAKARARAKQPLRRKPSTPTRRTKSRKKAK
ncbi:MAG: hypothetical protein ACYC9P_07895 [Rudaea sp.]